MAGHTGLRTAADRSASRDRRPLRRAGKEFEAATVVLPTGTGKTDMLATLGLSPPDRTLVLVPSDTLRSQIG